MACPSFSVSVGIPIFGLGFTSSNQLIMGGGGGAGRSGVKNKLSSFKVDVRRKDLEEDATFEFPAGEDAPMCLDVHPTKPYVVTGVNSSIKNVMDGENKNCRLFKINNDKFELEKEVKTLKSINPEDYQRVARFSQDGTLVATGTTDGRVIVFRYPEFEPISEPMTISTDDEVLDVDINLEKEKLTCVLRDGLKLINLRGKNVGQVVQTISSASIVKNQKTEFRAFRYGRGVTKDFGFAVVNGVTKPGAYVVKYDAYSLEQLKVVNVSSKPITAVNLSPDGAILAFASSDLSITLLDAETLKPLIKVKEAHSFSITSIAISPDRRILASASADNTCHIVSLPLQFSSTSTINPLLTVLLALTIAAILLFVLNALDLDSYFEARLAAQKLAEISSSSSIQDASITKTVVPTVVETIIETIISQTPIASIKDEL